MSLRCSLLGHEYGESEIERDREERGDEVVISVTELERCKRCGNARVISENTEVTQRSTRSAPRTNVNAGADASEPAARQEREESLDEARTTATDRSLEAGPSSAADVDSDPGTEDAEILDAEASEDDSPREPGAWPEHGEPAVDEGAAAAGTTEWPSVEGEDEGFDASVPDGEPTDVEFGGGITPRSVDQGAEILEGVTSSGERESNVDAEFVRAGASPAPDRSADVEGETELYCPNCDTSDLDERDSLRAGDICPACHRGYLAERER